MFDKAALQRLQAGFQKGKLKGFSNTDPSRLALTFGKPTPMGQMMINTVRIRLDGKPIFSAGFGKPPHKTSYIMFTVAPNPHQYTLANVNQDLKPLKLQASLSGGQLLLIGLVREKSFFDCINHILKATKMLVR